MRSPILLLLPLLLASACDGSQSPRVGNAVQMPAPPPDSDILALMYDDNYAVPDGFFVDQRAATARSYTLHHVLDDTGSFELCTDDPAQAADWDAADNASRSVRGYFVSSIENDRYYEFVRELAYEQDLGNIDEPTSPGFSRVFKCSHVVRDGVDRSALTGYAGTLRTEPLDPASLRLFAEYFWQFTFLPATRKKVVATASVETDTGFAHVMQLAILSRDRDGCDRIEVANWEYAVDRMSGAVTRRFEPLRQFLARLENGTPVKCG